MIRIKLAEETQNPFMNFETFIRNSQKKPNSELILSLDRKNQSSENCPVVYDETDKALCVLEELGYFPKVFCIHELESPVSSFEVLSDRWNWLVSPVNAENINQIPDKFLYGLGVLLKNNIKIDAVALASPKPKEAVAEVMKQEMQNGLEVMIDMVKVLFLGIIALLSGMIGNGLRSDSTSLVKFPDPVLLVKIQEYWIEIGRWE